MKLLTNIQTSQLGGIGQSLFNLIKSLEKSNLEKLSIVGVEVTSEPNSSDEGINYHSTPDTVLQVVSIAIKTAYFGDIIRQVNTVSQIRDSYAELIDAYKKIIIDTRPDLILINGTYFVPWCLFQAGTELGIPMVLHYHGILTKETSHYEIKLQKIIRQMEQTFDNDNLFYIFPSELAKTTVETEVFGHKIAKIAIIPNAIPDHFFKVKSTGHEKNIAFVGRWSSVKNPNFMKKISRYDKGKHGNMSFSIVSDKKTAQDKMGNGFNNVSYFDPMNSGKLGRFYDTMGMVICPSYFETYGNVAQESIATGTPALVGPNMGIAETFRQIGLSDYIVDFKSTKNVYKKIKQFSGQPISHKIIDLLRSGLTTEAINARMIRVLKSV